MLKMVVELPIDFLLCVWFVNCVDGVRLLGITLRSVFFFGSTNIVLFHSVTESQFPQHFSQLTLQYKCQ